MGGGNTLKTLWDQLVWVPPSGDRETDERGRFFATLMAAFLPVHVLTGLWLLPWWSAPAAPTSTPVFQAALALTLAVVVGCVLNRRGRHTAAATLVIGAAELGLVWGGQAQPQVLVMATALMLVAAALLPIELAAGAGLLALAAHPALLLFPGNQLLDIVLPFSINATFLSLGAAVRLHYLRRERIRRDESQRQERWHSTTLSSIGDAVLTVDRSQRVTFMNSVAETLTGWTSASANGRQVAEVVDLVDEQTGQPVETSVPTLLANAEGGECVQRGLLSSGQDERRPITSRGAPIVADDGSVFGVVLVFRDMTEQYALDAQVRHSQRLNALGTLAGGVAHDFNNLLTVITGRVEFLEASLSPQPDAMEDLEEISNATERAVGLTSQLLAFSSRQVMQVQTVQLKVAIAEATNLLRRLLRENIQLVHKSDADSGWISVDPVQLEQVLINLAINAGDAMPTGGTLAFSTDQFVVSKSTPGLGVNPGRYARLRVSDTGTGMSTNTQKKIFEPFFTTKERGHGTGLGLATVYGIVQQIGGTISVESNLGEGTTFELLLPSKAQPTEEDEAPTSQRRVSETPAGQRILLVEDDDGVRLLASRTLRREGYTVLEASNGKQALALMEGMPADAVDLLLTDVVMPGMGGAELAQVFSKRWPAIPILFMSGYADEIMAHEGVTKGRRSFLAKPFASSGLLSAAARALNGETQPASVRSREARLL